MRSPTVSARFTVSVIGQVRFSSAWSRPMCRASTLGAISLSLPLNSSPISFSTSFTSMSSRAVSAPTYMMFLNSWRWRGSLYWRLQIAVSGMPITVTSLRNFDVGSGFVLS